MGRESEPKGKSETDIKLGRWGLREDVDFKIITQTEAEEIEKALIDDLEAEEELIQDRKRNN